MIPQAFITHWRHVAPWAGDHQVEHDLVRSRVLVEIFSDARLTGVFAFRGGTAIHKLLLASPLRYSDDIDLVQVEPGPIGSTMRALREGLDPLLGPSSFERGRISSTAVYRFQSEIPPVQPLKLRIEVNTREHFAVLGFIRKAFTVDSPWFSGVADLLTFRPEELYATKLRALYQREKGRDLFDLAIGLERELVDPAQVVRCCLEYLKAGKTPISRRQFTDNLRAKIRRPEFRRDITPLLAPDISFAPDSALESVLRAFIDLWPH